MLTGGGGILTLLIKRQQKLVFHHSFYKSLECWKQVLICYLYQINWHHALLDGVLSPHRILNLKLIQTERFKMGLSLWGAQTSKAEIPHRTVWWFNQVCPVARRPGLWATLLHTQVCARRLYERLPWGSRGVKTCPRGELQGHLQVWHYIYGEVMSL